MARGNSIAAGARAGWRVMTQAGCRWPIADNCLCGSPTPRREAYCTFHASISAIQRRTQIVEHRSELTVAERADHVSEWVRLTESRRKVISAQPALKLKSDENPKGAGRLESGVN